VLEEEVRVGQAFKMIAPYFRMFAAYLASYDRALETKEELMKKVGG